MSNLNENQNICGSKDENELETVISVDENWNFPLRSSGIDNSSLTSLNRTHVHSVRTQYILPLRTSEIHSSIDTEETSDGFIRQFGFNLSDQPNQNISLDLDPTYDINLLLDNRESPEITVNDNKSICALPTLFFSPPLSPDTPSGVDKIMENIDHLIQIKLEASSVTNDSSSAETDAENKKNQVSERGIGFKDSENKFEVKEVDMNETTNLANVKIVKGPEVPFHISQSLLPAIEDNMSDNGGVLKSLPKEQIDSEVLPLKHNMSIELCSKNRSIESYGIMDMDAEEKLSHILSDSDPSCLEHTEERSQVMLADNLETPVIQVDKSPNKVLPRRHSTHDAESSFELVGMSGTCKITGSSSLTTDIYFTENWRNVDGDSGDEIEAMCMKAIRKLSDGEHTKQIDHEVQNNESTTTSSNGVSSPYMFSTEVCDALGEDDQRYKFAFCSDHSGPTTDVESVGGRDIDIMSIETDLERIVSPPHCDDLRRVILDAFANEQAVGNNEMQNDNIFVGYDDFTDSEENHEDMEGKDGLTSSIDHNEGQMSKDKSGSTWEEDSKVVSSLLDLQETVNYGDSTTNVITRKETLRSLLMNTPACYKEEFPNSPSLDQSSTNNRLDMKMLNADGSDVTMVEMAADIRTDVSGLQNCTASNQSKFHLDLSKKLSDVAPRVEQWQTDAYRPGNIPVEAFSRQVPNLIIGEYHEDDEASEESCRDSAFYGSRGEPSPEMPSLPTVTLDYFVSTDLSTPFGGGASPDPEDSLIFKVENGSTDDLSLTPSLPLSNLPSETRSLNIAPSLASSFATLSENQVTPASSLPEYAFTTIEEDKVSSPIERRSKIKTKKTKPPPPGKSPANSSRSLDAIPSTLPVARKPRYKSRSIPRSASKNKKKTSPVLSRKSESLPSRRIPNRPGKITTEASCNTLPRSIQHRRMKTQLSKEGKNMKQALIKNEAHKHRSEKVTKLSKASSKIPAMNGVKLRTHVTNSMKQNLNRRSWPAMQSDRDFNKLGLKRSASFLGGMNRADTYIEKSCGLQMSPEKQSRSRRTLSAGSSPLRLAIHPKCIDLGITPIPNSTSSINDTKNKHEKATLIKVNDKGASGKSVKSTTKEDSCKPAKDTKLKRGRSLIQNKNHQGLTIPRSSISMPSSPKHPIPERKSFSHLPETMKSTIKTTPSSKQVKKRSERLSRSSCSDEILRKKRDPSSSRDRANGMGIARNKNKEKPNIKVIPSSSPVRTPTLAQTSALPKKGRINSIPAKRPKAIGAIKALGANMQAASLLARSGARKNSANVGAPKSIAFKKDSTSSRGQKKLRSPVKSRVYKDLHKRPMSSNDASHGEGSPTLPWNRPQSSFSKQAHEANVLGAAERAVLRIADERDRVQKKTFTKWINQHLVKCRRQVDNLYEDLRDGHNLIALLEVLSGQTLPREGNYMNQMRLPREKGRMRFHRLQNVQIALDFLKKRKIRLVNIRNDDITDGNPKLTLGLIWTIILHFQLEDIAVEGEDDLSAKQALLLWAQRNMEGYDDLVVKNFTSSWRDGKVFNAIIHRNRPELIDMDRVRSSDNKANLENAFSVLERELAVTRLLDPEDVDVEKPDERSLITYVSCLYDVFPRVPPLPTTVTVEEWHFSWEEYRILVTSLLEWIRKQIIVLRKRDDVPCETVNEAETLLGELQRFQSEELPRKEADKNQVEPKYIDVGVIAQKSLGKFQIPAGYEPAKVDEAWRELMDAMNQREGILSNEYKRLLNLHNLALKITSEAAECRAKLDKAERLIKIIETEGDDSDEMQKDVKDLLDDCEVRIRVMFGDVQTLKDENYFQAEDMYKTVFVLHEKWVGLRSSFTLALKDAPNVRAAILARLRPKLEDTKDYRFLHECIQWVNAKQNEVETPAMGNDLPGVEQQAARLNALKKEIEAFEDNVKKCLGAKNNFDQGTCDYTTYTKDLSDLEVAYSLLNNGIKIRQAQMDSLLKFIREATKHLMWLNEKQEKEEYRDLTDFIPDVAPLERNYQTLKSDLKDHETPFQDTVHDGDRLVREEHPARSTVQAYLTAMYKQWECVHNLLHCLQEHVQQIKIYRSFHDDCGDAERWLRDRESDLDSRMRSVSPDIEPEKAEQALQDVFEMKDFLQNFKPTVNDLISRSKQIPCVDERPNPVASDSNASVTALCSYKEMNIAIAKGEDCVLVEKLQPHKWTVINSAGKKGDVPSAIFTLPPPSARSIARAQSLERSYLALLELWRDRHARVHLLVTINNLQRNIWTVMSWTLESYRTLSPAERESALRALSNGLKEVEESDSNDPALAVKTASLRVEVQRCLKHADGLAKQLEEGDKDEEKCRTYISHLNVILRRLNNIRGVVAVRVKTSLPREVASVTHVINDHEKSVSELKTIEPEYSEVRDESRVLLDKEECTAPSKEELGNQLEVVEQNWDQTWNVSNLYLDKLKMVHLVLQSTKEAERVISEVEVKIEEHKEIPTDSESIRKQQIVFQTGKAKVSGMRDTLEEKEPMIASLQRDAQKASEVGAKVVSICHGPDLQVTEDVDANKYTSDVQDVVDRWQVCKVTVDGRLTKFNELLPQAEQSEAEEQRTRSLIDRLTKLLATLDSIETSQEAQMAVWLPRSIPALEKAEGVQEDVVKRVEDMKPEYDSAQTLVVTFINEEAAGGAPSLVLLRETLHKVQGKWASVWLMTHVYFEKIKGLLFTQQAITECEKTVNQYEKCLSERSQPTTDISELKTRNDLFQKLVADIPVHDSNFEALVKNLMSTREVASQLPAPLSERCNTDLDTYTTDVEELQKRWDAVKSHLMAMANAVKIQLPQVEKAAAQERLLSDLLNRIRALTRGLDSLTQAQAARMQVNLPSEPVGLEKCLAQQKDVQQRLNDLGAQFEPLVAECKSVLEHEDLDTPTATAVRDESREMIEKWNSLSEQTVLFLAKVKVLRDVAVLMHDVTNVVTRYENTLDANDHLPEKDLNALRKQHSILKALNDEFPTHDAKFPDVEQTLEIADDTSGKLAEVSRYPEQDVPQRQKEFHSVYARWQEIKKRLVERLRVLDVLIPEVERMTSEEESTASLLPVVDALMHELERIESAQMVRADVMLPSDSSAVSRVAQQQKVTVDQLKDDLAPRYEGLMAQCRPLVEKQGSTAPSVAKLRAAVERLDDKWERVSYLVLSYMNKLRLILELLERLSIAIPVLKRYESEVEKAKPNCNTDVNQLKEHCQVLRILQAEVPANDPKFDAVIKALKAAKEATKQSEDDTQPDQDVTTHEPACIDVTDRWEKVKGELAATLAETESLIPHAEKAALVESRAANLLPTLKELLAELESMEHAMRARITMATPAEPDSIDKAIAQQKVTSNRLDELEPHYRTLHSEIDALLEASEHDTPTLAQLRTDNTLVEQKWNIVRVLSELYLQKVSALRDIAEKLNDVTKVVGRFENVLNANENIPTKDLNALRQQCATLKKLREEVPENDPKFFKIALCMGEAKEIGDKLAEAAGSPEQDIPQWQGGFTDVENRWEDSKKRLNDRIAHVCDLIPKLEKAASEESNAASLLPAVESLMHELERLESAQNVRNDVMLPSDVAAVSRVVQQQKNIENNLNKNMRPQYDSLAAQCKDVLANSDSSAPSVDKLRDAAEKLDAKWCLVNDLVRTYLSKLYLILAILESLAVAQPVLKKYEEEVAKSKPDGTNDISKLVRCQVTLQALEAEVPTHDPKFDAVTDALRAAKDATQENGKEPDQDVAVHEPTCDDVTDRWKKIKSELHVTLKAVAIAIPIAEKSASIESRCVVLLPSLRELITELDSMEHAIRARIGMCMPSEPESVDKAISQQKDTADRLDKLEPTYVQLNKEIDSVLKSSDDDTPSLAQLRSEQKVAEKKWKNVRYLSTKYLEKLDCLRNAATSARVARGTVRKYEIELVNTDTLSGDAEGIKKQLKVLETLEKDIPKHEPEFAKVGDDVSRLHECATKLDKESGVPDMDSQQYQDMSDELDQRWSNAKDQVQKRLVYARVGEQKLTEYEDAANKQKEHLDKTDSVLQSDDLSQVKVESKDIAKQIKEHEDLGDEVDGQGKELQKLHALATEYDDAVKQYDETASKFVPCDADLAAKKNSQTKTITRVIGYEVTTITRRYDKLKNLISERVDRYKYDYDKAKDKEDAAVREEEEKNSTITTITEITTTTSKKRRSRKDILFNTAFRRKASLHDLHEAGCVPDDTTEKLELGVLSEEQVAPSLQPYLCGQQPISGIIIKKANNKKMSINEAMLRGVIMNGTGVGLLEAQAATGNMIDPLTGKMMTVEEAVKEGLVDAKYDDALKRAERAVTGYEDPVTHQTISLYEAMHRNFVVEGHGIRLLEAQIATGGLIDPRAHHRVPIAVAYRRGLFDERMNAILEDPSDDTKGFFDPNTKKNHTYLELMAKSKVDPVTGVRCLEMTRDDIDMRRITMEITEITSTTTTSRRSRHDIRFKTAFRRDATLSDIYDAGLITDEQIQGLEAGTIQQEDVEVQLRQYLFGGEEPIAGIIMQATGEKLSINEAVRKSIIKRGTGIELLEAQAATGNIIDPKTAKKLSVDEASKIGLIDRLHVDTLHRAERAVFGYKLPGTNKILSLFEAMKKGLVVESRGIRLLEAQIATGGLIDPRAAHRVPIAIAYKRGLFDERMNQILEDPSDDTKGFFDPNTQENLSYLDLMERCIIDEDSSLRFLVLEEKKDRRRKRREETVTKEVQRERRKKDSSKRTVVTEQTTETDGKSTRSSTVEKIVVTHETSKKKEPASSRDDIKFKTSYRREANLADLVKTGVVSDETATLLEHGAIKHADVYKQIRRNLEGDEPVGGVFIDSTKEKLSINEACKRGILMRGTALQFLEAQAATGNIIEPKSGERLGVKEAYSSGLIERAHMDPLERAERAVLGYKEKATQKILSLFECMRKGLVTETRGVRLLEAQIATGGLIDPRLNHRVPIAVAYKQGIFDERMNAILEDPSDDTKGFFDPNTMKNSSYLDLIQHCMVDPKTGIRLIVIKSAKPGRSSTTTTTTTIITKNRKDIRFKTGFLRTASVMDLLEAGIIQEETVDALEKGLISEEEVASSIAQYLHGEQPIAGLILEATGEKISILEAVQQGIIKRGTGLELLEAQAATGTIIDPRNGDRMSVTDAFGHGLVDNTQRDALERAQRAVTGYRDPISGQTLSLFAAMRKGYVTESRGIRLLEAQIATGGLIDPNAAHRVPISVAFRRGIFDQKMYDILEDPSDDTKGFFDPNTNENLTYLELMSRCQTEPDSEMVYLMLKDKRSSRRGKSSSSRKKHRTTQRSRKVVIVDPDTGKELSVREAYKKGLIDKATASQLMSQEGEWEETEEKTSSKKVAPSEQTPIVDSQTGANISIDDALDKSLVDKGTAKKFKLGEISAEELTSRLALLSFGHQGPIGGIVDLKKGECITLTEAERRRLIDGTSVQRLLEAQAATGGIVNPTDSSRLSIADAVTAGIIERRMGQRIEKAELAYRGFQDRRTKQIMSLGEAMKKGLCYYDAGLRLLEYQYVTGGLVDPHADTRISVDEAVDRSWIDQRTADRLTDIRRYARSIVDLKTNLLLTYPEALEQSQLDIKTGLRVMEALPRLERSVKMAGGITIRAGSMQSSLASSLSSSRAESPVGSKSGSRRGSFEGDSLGVASPISPISPRQ